MRLCLRFFYRKEAKNGTKSAWKLNLIDIVEKLPTWKKL